MCERDRRPGWAPLIPRRLPPLRKFTFPREADTDRGILIVDEPCELVRELVGRVRNAVLMNVYLDLENPGGSGFWVGGYMSQVREMGKLVYEQPGNEVDGSCHSKEGSK